MNARVFGMYLADKAVYPCLVVRKGHLEMV